MGFDFSRIAERKIQEAIDEGAFDDLPGKGKPLHLDDLPPHLRILRNAGVLPDWMQLHVEIAQERKGCERLWERTAREYARRRSALDAALAGGAVAGPARQDFAAWLVRAREGYLRALRRVNTEILKLNLRAPALLREQIPYRVAEEAERFDASFPPLPDVVAKAPVAREDRPEGTLHAAAAARYRAQRPG